MSYCTARRIDLTGKIMALTALQKTMEEMPVIDEEGIEKVKKEIQRLQEEMRVVGDCGD